MPLNVIREMKGIHQYVVSSLGVLYNDWDAVSEKQVDCTEMLAKATQIEEVAYLSKHPEVMAMLIMFLKKATTVKRKKDSLKVAGHFFTRPKEELDKCVREYLNLPPDGPYIALEECQKISSDLMAELKALVLKYEPNESLHPPSIEPETPITVSSSFLSTLSSSTTLATPEPIPTPEPTLSEIMLQMIENILEKAMFSKVTDNILRYDTAYVELMKAVEVAMEIPVIEIREDIVCLIKKAFFLFESIIDDMEKIAADKAWENRMRKKLKRTLRRQDNFKGYETPPTQHTTPSSHPSYKIPPQRPCKCHPQWTYNRYPKDRFGIYMPMATEFASTNITVTPNDSYLDIKQTELETDTQDNKERKIES